jgi:signal peptidase II
MRTEARREPVLTADLDLARQVDAVSTTAAGANVSTQPSTAQPHLIRLLIVGAIAVLGLVWDLWTKQQVFAQLGPQGTYPVWRGQILGMSIRFQLETTFNHGALWGMGQGKSWLFASLSVVALGAIAYFLWTRQAIASRWLTAITGLLLAGTLGNLYDRLGLHGWQNDKHQTVYAVRDFLDFYFFNDSFHWATFNFADTYLVVGACMLALHSFWVGDPDSKPATEQPAK